ncbi:hypothetical protein IMSHALPRED_006805 [Imshaugia aleurites]|uniref:Uncharacterized protein n=1 Tax=Imshaugia aleurites TaxID=172621 RepID=A0A8H3IF92_9LECA|nr:hypothetical protein IMSHALPRED_006805 [Imshaugia aleurites]
MFHHLTADSFLLPFLLPTLPTLINAQPTTLLHPRQASSTCTVTGEALSVGDTLQQQQTMQVTIRDAASGNTIGTPLSAIILDSWESGISQYEADNSLPLVMECTLATLIGAANGQGEFTFTYGSWGPKVFPLGPETEGNALNFTTGAQGFPC